MRKPGLSVRYNAQLRRMDTTSYMVTLPPSQTVRVLSIEQAGTFLGDSFEWSPSNRPVGSYLQEQKFPLFRDIERTPVNF